MFPDCRVRKYFTFEAITVIPGKFYNWLHSDNVDFNKYNGITADLFKKKENLLSATEG